MIGTADYPPYLWDPAKRGDASSALVVGSARIEEMERASLVAALSLCAGNRRLVAQRLGVSLRTVYNMLKRYHLAGK
jgi:two-component system response regulator FlrC